MVTGLAGWGEGFGAVRGGGWERGPVGTQQGCPGLGSLTPGRQRNGTGPPSKISALESGFEILPPGRDRDGNSVTKFLGFSGRGREFRPPLECNTQKIPRDGIETKPKRISEDRDRIGTSLRENFSFRNGITNLDPSSMASVCLVVCALGKPLAKEHGEKGRGLDYGCGQIFCFLFFVSFIILL